MIQATIFDMDGLLIDSEPLWEEAEMNILRGVGVPLEPEMMLETTGLRTDELVAYWHQKHPWNSPSQQEIGERIDEEAMRLIKKDGQPKAGVHEAMAVCQSLGLPIAIASSSPIELIAAVVEKFRLTDKVKVMQSAYDEPLGKPHPAVYISAAKKLGIAPSHCVAFEDTVNGVLSAKAAKMKCIAIPDPGMRNDKRFGIADTVLNSLHDLTPDILQE